jgi:hypothetical protein
VEEEEEEEEATRFSSAALVDGEAAGLEREEPMLDCASGDVYLGRGSRECWG